MKQLGILIAPRPFSGFAAVLLLALAAPALAQSVSSSVGDPCQTVGGPVVSSHARPIRIDRATAVFMIKHVQLACQDIQSWVQKGKPPVSTAQAEALNELARKAERDILVPIYGTYPEFRTKNLTKAVVKIPQSDAGCPRDDAALHNRPKPVSYRTGLRFTRILDELELSPGTWDQTPLRCAPAVAVACGQALVDIVGEFSFAANPIYQAYPDLWKISERRSARAFPAPARTVVSDAVFRKAKTVAGRLQFTPAALDYVRAYDNDSRGDGLGCQVNIIDWAAGEQMREPDDAGWTALPGGVMLGSYWCSFVPPDAVQTIGGVHIVVGDSEPERFIHKIIDLKNHHLVLESP